MNIILTIKAILNYLYNHLIDLINVKKIVFEDGTEQTTASSGGGSASLFDIKCLSQAIADKGWAFMCRKISHNNIPFLNKSDIPTVYDNIFNKYNNAEKSFSALTQGSNLKDSDNNYNTFDINGFGICVFGNTTYAILNNDYKLKIYYSSSYQSGATWSLLSDIDDFTALFKANNCIIALSYNSVYKINPSTNTITKIGNNIDSDYGLSYRTVKFKLINGIIYIIKKSNNTDTSAIYKRIYYVADDTTTNTLSYIGNYSRVVCDLEYVNNSWYILARNGYTFYVYKGNDINNKTLTDTTKWELKLTYRNTNWDIEQNGEMFYGNNRFAVFFKRFQANYDYVYTDDDFATTSVKEQVSIGNDDFCPLYFCNNIFYSIYKPSTFPYLYYCHIDNLQSAWTYDSSLTPNPLVSDSTLIGLFLTDTLQLMGVMLPSGTPSNFIYYRGYGNTVYTDSYSIDGNVITVNYAMYEDNFGKYWKICISDNSSNDDNLKKVYAHLGYLNYWILDTANEKICIQLDNQPYKLMYVGDDFDEELTNVIEFNTSYNATRVKPQNTPISLTGATITTSSIVGGLNYYYTNANITSITWGGCEDSELETVIRFRTGNTAPTLIDNTGITWVDGNTPVLNPNKNYTILIVNKTGYVREY